MHPNPNFRGEPDARNLSFARERGFGVLAVSYEKAPLLAHVPFLISEEGTEAELHLVRSNSIARAMRHSETLAARISVSGPDSYISPDWYGAADQVPTWNYVAVHLAGVLEPLPQEALPGLLARLSASFEARLAPKPPWTQDKMTPEVLDKMLRVIAPFRMRIDAVEGTWKLNQNKTADIRRNAADAVSAYGLGHETAMMSALIHGVDKGIDPT